ncbi:hypothetical protein BDN72DRAFT_814134 [Pluteus cervinus]|uniref:Uncharacterized protein n=1 Tax=Pluteus cervinus TaxID=181527 RepID=A0ACD3B7F8_9AGAR|nr:hypothetical protein BDN72DRAFT_814134 [Pluteus cervinus]
MQHHQNMPDSPQESNALPAQQGPVLPTPSMQNHIHELAKTLPPPRKQNTACDACRSRKVKCNRLPGQDKNKHCLSKNYPCTHFVQQATSEKKRVTANSRRPRNLTSNNSFHSIPAPPRIVSTLVENGALGSPPFQSNFPLLVRYGFYPPITLHTPTKEVLPFLFAPPETMSSEPTSFAHVKKSHYTHWGELAVKLEDDNFKAEFALDLVEVFFQIVHTRLPLLNPAQFRNSLRLHPSSIPSSDKPLHPALVATVLAWGSKFSEHPLLIADRQRPGGQSLLAKALVERARDLAEALKVHRIASPDHVVIGLLIEPLQSQNPEDTHGFHGFWLTSATRHLLDLQINHKAVMSNIQDPEARGTMIFAWWMACLCDAYASAYYRRKPVLDDEDYDIDFYTVDPIPPEMGESQTPLPSPREQLEFLGYYRAAHSLARTARHLSRQLWRPTTESEGVTLEVLGSIAADLSSWRDQFLALVGVPSNFDGEWDFVSAVSSCASDATYHVMWIILFNAVDEFGVREHNEANRSGSPISMAPNHVQIENIKRKISDEALHGALRISGLAGVLTSNGYLRLDPAVMHVSCIQAGTLLARLGRPEVSNCIAGLEQYSHSYEEAGDQAAEMRRLYNTVRAGENELNHMSNVAPRFVPTLNANSHAMLVDSPIQNGRNGSHSVSPTFAPSTSRLNGSSLYG